MRKLPVAVVLTMSLSLPAFAAEVTAGGVLNPLGYVAGLGVELGVGDSAAVEVQGSHMGYEYDETGYHEEGSGPLLGVRARWYPQDTGNATKVWLAGGLMAGSVNVYWVERNGGVFVRDEEKTTTLGIVQVGVGYKLLFADERFVVDPQLLLAYLANADTDTNVIAGLGVYAGLRF